MSFVTVPSFPTMPDGLLSPCDEAEVLRELCISGPMSVRQGAAVLKIPKARALHLQALWRASSELQAFIRGHHIAPEAAGLLARIETFDPELAHRVAKAYLRRDTTTAGLHLMLDELIEQEADTGSSQGHQRGGR